jgi:hypothetical protein
MTLKVVGPRAFELVKLMSEFSGLPLELKGGHVDFSADGLMAPFESETLKTLIKDCMKSHNSIRITAFGGHPDTTSITSNHLNPWGDSFNGWAPIHLPDRSVYVHDLKEVAKASPSAGRILLGHILKEYLGGSLPPGMGHSHNYRPVHLAAIPTEAKIAHDLTRRPIWSGGSAPSERTVTTMSGLVNIRSYGPSLTYEFHFDASLTFKSVKPPHGIR